MLLENIINSYMTLFSLSSFLIFLGVFKISSKYFKRSFDLDFKKPQAFHTEPIPRIGGLALFCAFVMLVLSFQYVFKVNLYEYLIISFLIFILGFSDDLKFQIGANIRLILMTLIFSISIIFFNINIEKTGLAFLNLWLENNIFNLIFVLICFLFVVNGSNFIDGFNGLLAIHSFIIISFLTIILTKIDESSFYVFLTGQLFVIFVFILFNFPKAKIFLGDSGSYLLGSLIALNTIKVSHLVPSVSPFFFCSLLFYIFFEVFFSFIRKSLKRKSPLKPDNNHLHMLIFKYFNTRNNKSSNPITSVVINLFYFILIIPAFLFKENALFSRYWFFLLLFVYLISYFLMKKKT